jgi:hypothetical protein
VFRAQVRRARILLSLLLVFTFTSIAAGAAAASANVDVNGPGPYAAMDANGKQYVFWKDSNTAIGEAFYNGARWFGDEPIKDADIASAPSIVVSPSQYQSGGSAYQFLFWIGAGSDHNLLMAYYGSSGWKGPYDLGMGDLGVSNFAPAAAVYNDTSNSTAIMVAWIIDNHVSYTYSDNATDPSSWHSPITVSNLGPTNAEEPSLTSVPGEGGTYPAGIVAVFLPSVGFQQLDLGYIMPGQSTAEFHDLGDGPLGSTTTSYSFFTDEGGVGDFPAFTFWEGTSGNLYGMYFDPADGYNSGTEEWYAGQLASAPSVDASTNGLQVYFYWICSNGKTLCQVSAENDQLTNLGFEIPYQG